MGLDLVFDRKQAEEAGLQFEVYPVNGTYDEDDDPEYIEWCKSNEEVIKVPNAAHYVCNDAEGTAKVMVRANKWGNSYYPLTAWLKEHNISCNAMREFLNAIGTNKVLCADILYVHDNVDVTIQLKCSYSFEDWNTFIEKLNFEYNDADYRKRVWGTIWFTNGSWAEREENEYDGTTDWYLYSYPNIPESLM